MSQASPKEVVGLLLFLIEVDHLSVTISMISFVIAIRLEYIDHIHAYEHISEAIAALEP